MKQVIQNIKSGATALVEVPVQKVKAGHVLILTSRSLISAGTEKMLVSFSKANLLNKARQQPEKVKMVFDKIKTDGLLTTIETVRSKLDSALPLGYCNVGIIIDVGHGVAEFKVGDRVASNGPHSEVVCVPEKLCAKIPDEVDDESAAFTVLSSVALQGIRLAQPTLGEAFCVIGLGLVGLITVQLLKANGCKVIGADFDPERLKLARLFGAEIVNLSQGEDIIAVANTFSQGRGVDGVLITASTDSNEPISQAAKISRKRGRIILVGVTGLELSRSDFYEKELSFQVSCSYGPGRYDAEYEIEGHDYPIGYVRWTEQRNFEAILEMLRAKKLDVSPLITHRFLFDEVERAYDTLTKDKSSLGIILKYPANASKDNLKQNIVSINPVLTQAAEEPCIGVIGAGNYASRVLLPAFKKTAFRMKTIVTQNGLSGVYEGKKLGFENAATDIDLILHDNEINTIVIASRHDTHAKYALEAARAGKNIFVEKPLCINLSELEVIAEELLVKYVATRLMIGFNRRFAPHVKKIVELFKQVKSPKNFIMTVNAGYLPKEHWTQDPNIGGGRLIGEVCHFVDLLRFLAGAPITQANVSTLSRDIRHNIDENVIITLCFADGSQGVINYFANGHRAISKERLEIFTEGKTIQLDNFRKLKAFGFKSFKKSNLFKQDKGQKQCVQEFMDIIKKGLSSPIPLNEIIEVTRVCLNLRKQLDK